MNIEKYPAGVPFGPASERAKKALMSADLKLFDAIATAGGIEEYVEATPELAECFTDKKPYVCCIDERTAKGSIHVPGSGILIEGVEAQAAFRARLKAENCQGVYSHDNCGAVKIYAQQEGITDYNAAAKEYAQKLAGEMGVEYLGHLKTSGEHPGRAVYFDATGRLDTESAVWQEKMPTGFTVTRGALSPREAMDFVILGVRIAFSEHGYGPNMFSEKDPMSLVVIGRTRAETVALETELQNELSQIVAQVPAAMGKIVVTGFTTPEAAPSHRKSATNRVTTSEPSDREVSA